MKHTRIILLSAIGIVLTGIGFLALKPENRNFSISKNFDIIHSIFRELDMYYVDSTDVNKVFNKAIRGMLSSYDPYTEYIPEEDISDFQYMTTGEYGGIGAMIMQRDQHIIISEPYENMPAQKAGLQFGDEIIEINGEKMEGKDVSYASSLLKGQPKTELTLLIQREGEKKLIQKKIIRQLVLVDQVQYYGMVAPEVGYIYLNGFTDKAYQEVRQAAVSLKEAGAKKLILDLRDNGGGLLTEAVSICNLFIGKGETIVSTKGKVQKWDRVYKTMREPLDTDIPLVILTNNSSASSSEIVAGAMQDLDRAVILGTRTYGKGLVQTTREVAFDGLLKVTTAKYYIPSGRCIQAIDYSHRNADGSVGRLPDSLTTEFTTRAGRLVRDGGGIAPDIEMENEELSNLCYQLATQMFFFDYANQYFAKHPKIAPIADFAISDQDYLDFKNFVVSKGIKYDTRSKKEMETLKKVLEYEGYLKTVETEFNALEEKLNKDLNQDLDTFRPEIEQFLSREIVLRYYYQRGEMEEAIKNDPLVEKAVEVLSTPSLYHSLLQPKMVSE